MSDGINDCYNGRMPDLPYKPCSHDELKWGRKKEIIGGKEIIVCGRCREEMPAIYTKPGGSNE